MEGGASETHQDGEEAETGRGLAQETGQGPQGERGPDRHPDRDRRQAPQE